MTRLILATMTIAPIMAQAQPSKALECNLIASVPTQESTVLASGPVDINKTQGFGQVYLSDVESVYCVKMENAGFRCIMQNKYQGEAGPRVGVDIKANSSASIFVNDGRPGTKDYVLNCVAK